MLGSIADDMVGSIYDGGKRVEPRILARAHSSGSYGSGGDGLGPIRVERQAMDEDFDRSPIIRLTEGNTIEGATDFLQVLDTQRTELDAEDRLAQGRTDTATAYAALYKAVGGR